MEPTQYSNAEREALIRLRDHIAASRPGGIVARIRRSVVRVLFFSHHLLTLGRAALVLTSSAALATVFFALLPPSYSSYAATRGGNA